MNPKQIRKNILCTLAENIRKARERMGYTQNTLAALMEIDPETIYNYETGRYFPAFPNLVKLIDVLEVTPNDILCEKRELSSEEAKAFQVELPKQSPLPKRQRVRFKAGEEPNVAVEMKGIIAENIKMKQRARKRRIRNPTVD